MWYHRHARTERHSGWSWGALRAIKAIDKNLTLAIDNETISETYSHVLNNPHHLIHHQSQLAPYTRQLANCLILNPNIDLQLIWVPSHTDDDNTTDAQKAKHAEKIAKAERQENWDKRLIDLSAQADKLVNYQISMQAKAWDNWMKKVLVADQLATTAWDTAIFIAKKEIPKYTASTTTSNNSHQHNHWPHTMIWPVSWHLMCTNELFYIKKVRSFNQQVPFAVHPVHAQMILPFSLMEKMDKEEGKKKELKVKKKGGMNVALLATRYYDWLLL